MRGCNHCDCRMAIPSMGYKGCDTCTGLTLESMKIITNKCVNLKEASFSDTNLSEESINHLANNLTSEIIRLDLSSLVFCTDPHINTLVSRCTKLSTLSLRNTGITGNALDSIVEHLKPSLEELDVSESYLGDPSKLLVLKAMPKLKTLIARTNISEFPYPLHLKRHLFHLNYNTPNPFFLPASPREVFIQIEDGFWEIDVKKVTV